MTNSEAMKAASESLAILDGVAKRGPEYKKAWDDFAREYELPKESPRQGCGVYRPSKI
jgi:predicted Zn-dependent protease